MIFQMFGSLLAVYPSMFSTRSRYSPLLKSLSCAIDQYQSYFYCNSFRSSTSLSCIKHSFLSSFLHSIGIFNEFFFKKWVHGRDKKNLIFRNVFQKIFYIFVFTSTHRAALVFANCMIVLFEVEAYLFSVDSDCSIEFLSLIFS